MPPNRSPTELLAKAPGYLAKTVRRWLIEQYWKLYFRRNPDHGSLDRSRAVAEARRADSVLFLCWGNVCRSPFAERYLRRRLADRDLDHVAVDSAGLGRAQGRSSPDAAIRTARTYGVDLADHRSKLATDLDAADVVFVMDCNNFHSVANRSVDGRVFFLGALADEYPGTTIPDPYGGDERRFERTYRAIADAVDEVADALDDGGP